MIIKGVEFETEWTTDCGGKQSFDFPVVEISTRYWPDHTSMPSVCIGGAFFGIEIKPDDYISGKTESECKYKTEQWIEKEVGKIISVLKNELYTNL